MKYFNLKFLTFFLTALLAFGVGWAETVTDVITAEGIGVTSTSYTNWNNKTFTSDAVYAGMTARKTISNKYYIQVNKGSTTNGYGLVSTTSGGKVKSITITINTNSTDGGKFIDIYGKNEAYTASTELYNSTTQGTKIGEAKTGDATTTITPTDDYEYIGIRARTNVAYITDITIVWEIPDTGAPYITVEPEDGLTINDATGDNVAKTGTLTATLTNGQGDLTATTSSSVWSWNNNTATFAGYSYDNGNKIYLPLHDEATVTFSSTNATDVTADLEYNYTGPLYILGTVNGWTSWGANNAVEIAEPDANGIYTVTLTTAAGEQGMSWISFSKRVAENNDDGGWAYIAPYRFSLQGENVNTAYWLTEDKINTWIDLDFNPDHAGNQPLRMDPGTYNITIDAKNNKFKIERYEVPVPKIYNKVVQESQLIAGKKYILVNEDKKKYCGEITLSGSNYIGYAVDGPDTSEGSVDIYGYNDIKELTLGYDEAWTFHNGDGYLHYPGGNQLNVVSEIENGQAKWTVSSSDDGFILTNAYNTDRVLQYNSSSPRFACYTGSQQPAVLYVEDGVEPVYPSVENPTFSPAERNFAASVDVTIECETTGATIYYTLDGTEPSATSTAYTAPIHLTATTTIKAIAVLGEDASSVVEATYTKTGIETIAAVKALNPNTNLTYIGNAVVTFQRGNNLFVRDETGSIMLYYGQGFDQDFKNGDILTPEWSGKYQLYNSIPEVNLSADVTSTVNNGPADPEVLTVLNIADVNKYAKIDNVTITRSDTDHNNYYFTVDENEYCLHCAYTDLVSGLTVGKRYNVTGIASIYNNEPQLNLITADLIKEDLTLEFEPASVEIYVGDTFTAPTLTGVPEGETINVAYSSNNTELATVTDNVVSLVEGATGTATITANFAGNDLYNEATATYTITVNEKLAHGMSFSAETLNVTYGDEDYEAPTLNNPNSLTVTYESDNEDVAVVDENTGELLLGDAGTAVITAKTKGDASHNGGSVSYTVNIAKAAAGLAYETAQYTVYAGQDFEAPTLTNPNKLTVTYESSNEDVALVDETGDVLIGEKVGDAKITAKFEGNKNYEAGSASYTIHVIAKDNVTMSFDPTSVTLYVDEEFAQPTLTTNPANLPVKYSSNNEEVAMVDETSGEVLLMEKAGTATITAKYAGNDQYNEASATYTITVENRPEILIDDESLDLGTTGEGEIFVMASDLKENVTVTSSNENFKVEPPTITPEQAANGVNVTVTYTGNNPEGESTTITFSTKDGEDVKVTVTAKAETYVDIAKPTFSPKAGTYTEPKEVAIACATPGVTIEYTIDGVTKTYEGPFLVNHNCTVTATAKMGTRTVYTPATAEAQYTINAAAAAEIADNYYYLQNNALSDKYANVAGRRTLNFVGNADEQAGTVFRVETGEGGAVKTLRSQAVDLQGYAKRAMAYVGPVVQMVINKLNDMSGVDDATGTGNILGNEGLEKILAKFNECFDYNLYVEQAEGGYRIYARTPSMQNVVDFYNDPANNAQIKEKLPMLEGYINQVLDKIRAKVVSAGMNGSVIEPFSLVKVWEKMGGQLIKPEGDNVMAFYDQVLTNKEYVWDFAYQTAMIYFNNIKQTETYGSMIPAEYQAYIEKMQRIRPETKYYMIQYGNEPDYVSENNVKIIGNDPSTYWTLTPRENFTVNVPEANKLNDSYYTTLYTDFAYTLPEGVTAYAVTDIDDNDVAQLAELSSPIAAQTPVLLKANAAGTVNVTLTTAAGNTPETNLLEGPDYLVKTYGITSPTVEAIFNLAAAFVPADMLAEYEYLKLRTSGTVNNKYFWNVNDALEKLTDDCVVRSLAVKDGTLAFSEHWKTETNKAFLVSDTKPVIYLEKETLAAPTFSPVPGSYTVDNGQNVTITITAEDDATIYYKIGDGEYQRYNGPITASDDMTIVAKAEKDGMIASDEVTAVYVIDNPAELPDVPAMKGYYQIKNNGNSKYANVAGRKTLNFVEDPADKAGTVIWLETNDKGQVQSLRSQAADLQRYADRAMSSYVPNIVELVADKLNADGVGNLLGHEGLEKIMDKFNESFDHHLYVEQAEGGYRLYGKTPSMQPVVEFYRENTAQVEAKLPMLEDFINSALNKLKEKIGGSSVFTPFSLLNIWELMGGTLTKPEDEASTMAFYREVLNNKNYVWDFAYQTAMIYLNNIKGTQTYKDLVNEHPEISQYIDKIDQIRPDFKYYIVQKDDKPDFISQGNVDIKNNAARTIWTVEPRTTFTVNSASELFGCPLATNGVGGYFTTNYTDFAYTLPEGVTAYKVTGVNDEGEATLEALSGTIPAQTPVLLVAKEDKPYELTLTTDAGTAVTGNLLVGPDYLINEYDLKTAQVQGIFDMIKQKLGQDFYNNYVAQYEHLADLNSGTVNNKYFWNVNSYLDYCTYKNANNEDECVVRSLATNENGELAFSEHWKTETNKAFLVSDTFDVITLPSLERGDVNHDGFVNLLDVTDLIDRLLVIPDAEHLKACPYCSDVDGNGSVNIKDVTVLIDILLENPATEPEGGDGN
ncbi:MAG: hypothetical protein E7078_03750 [Bacteroidales bacterium]|nr:hypothetical protein [Bacteroidales bacterium]